jgi:hypothetical protein
VFELKLSLVAASIIKSRRLFLCGWWFKLLDVEEAAFYEEMRRSGLVNVQERNLAVL